MNTIDLDRLIKMVDDIAEGLAEYDAREVLEFREGVSQKIWDDIAFLKSSLQIESYYTEEVEEVDFSNEDALDWRPTDDSEGDETEITEEDWISWRPSAKAN